VQCLGDGSAKFVLHFRGALLDVSPHLSHGLPALSGASALFKNCASSSGASAYSFIISFHDKELGWII